MAGYVVKTMIVKIDAQAYECEVTGVQMTPQASTQTVYTACPTGKLRGYRAGGLAGHHQRRGRGAADRHPQEPVTGC